MRTAPTCPPPEDECRGLRLGFSPPRDSRGKRRRQRSPNIGGGFGAASSAPSGVGRGLRTWHEERHIARMDGRGRRPQDAVWSLARGRTVNRCHMHLLTHLRHRAAPQNTVGEERCDVIPAFGTELLLPSPAARRRSGDEKWLGWRNGYCRCR